MEMERVELIPFTDQSGLFEDDAGEGHLTWLSKKLSLQQDVVLVGVPGPLRRWLAMHCCGSMGREIEYVALTRDTTSSDLKQRREIREGMNSVFVDQIVVEAALHGRLLILDGLEKAERNVLPVLNNLLENREMMLEDGRFLIPSHRFDKLKADGSIFATAAESTHTLVRVHPNFQVIALGVPPPFPGNPLDPPLRSRFQARKVDAVSTATLRQVVARTVPNANFASLDRLLVFTEALSKLASIQANQGAEGHAVAFHHLPMIAEIGLLSAARMVSCFPTLTAHWALMVVYPWKIAVQNEDARNIISQLYTSLCQEEQGGGGGGEMDTNPYTIAVLGRDAVLNETMLKFSSSSGECFQLAVAGGQGSIPLPSAVAQAQIGPNRDVMLGILQSHAVGRDICIVGGHGQGKSHVVCQFADIVGYAPIEHMVLYSEMTARDLLQKRTTTVTGVTVWQDSALVTALRRGRLVVLDGLHRLHPAVFAIVHRLIQDRELTLFDGTHVFSREKFDLVRHELKLNEEEMMRRGNVAIHPSFRIIALAEYPTRMNSWLSAECMHLFHFYALPPLFGDNKKIDAVKVVLQHCVPNLPMPSIQLLCDIASRLNFLANDPTVQLGCSLSLRSLLRISRQSASFPEEFATSLSNSMMLRFMVRDHRDLLVAELAAMGVNVRNNALNDDSTEPQENLTIRIIDNQFLEIGHVRCPLFVPNNPALVPDIVYYDNDRHTVLLMSMLRDFVLGEHLLLVGNQGVGKNKLADRLLQLLRCEREYIQLHRDTTVQSLTLSPSLFRGVVVWEDSPLVLAMKFGRVLEIDEADKAPTEVGCILKTLIENGEITLSDGRRFVTSWSRTAAARPLMAQEEDSKVHIIHPNFRIIALANRPGHPFLGNDLFAEMGDVFACHSVDNPDQHSEMQMLRFYGPSIPDKVLQCLTSAFSELRQMADEGKLSYPYSTREMVAVVKHLEAFPNDSIADVLDNVISFSAYDEPTLRILLQVFYRHGIPIASKVRQVTGATLTQAVALSSAVPWAQLSVTADALRRVCQNIDAELVFSTALRKSEQQRNDNNHNTMFDSNAVVLGQSVLEKQITTTTGTEEVFTCQLPFASTGMVVGATRFDDGSDVVFLLSVYPLAVHAVDLGSVSNVLEAVTIPLQPLLSSPSIPMQSLPISLSLPRRLASDHASMAAVHFLHQNTPVAMLVVAPAYANRILCVSIQSMGVQCYDVPFSLTNNQQLDAANLSPLVVMEVSAAGSRSCLVYRRGTHSLAIFSFMSLNAARWTVIEIPEVKSIQSIVLLSNFTFLVWNATGQIFMLSLHGASEASLPDFALPRSQISFYLRAVHVQIPLERTPMSAIHYVSPPLSDRNVVASLDFAAGFLTPFSPRHTAATLMAFPHARAELDRRSRDVDFLPQRGARVCSKLLRNNSLLINLLSSNSNLRLEAVDTASGAFVSIPLSSLYNPRFSTSASGIGSSSPSALVLGAAVDALELASGRIACITSDYRIRLLEIRNTQGHDDNVWQSMMKSANNHNYDDGDDDDDDGDDIDAENDGDGEDDRGNSNRRGVGKGGGGGMGKGNRSSSGKGSGSGSGGSGGGSRGGRGGGGKTSSSIKDTNFNKEYKSGSVSVARKISSDESGKEAAIIVEKAKKAAAKVRSVLTLDEGKYANRIGLDRQAYDRLYNAVRSDIVQLRMVFEAAQAKEQERVWLRNRTNGELDDNKLVDGATGEAAVFRTRGKLEPQHGMIQQRPKRIALVMDVSASMSRFNGMDRRLDRMLATTLMLMESFRGFESKYDYSILGHDGEEPAIPFVKWGKPPQTVDDRLKIIGMMDANARYCMSGDHTLAAIQVAVSQVTKDEADDYLVIALSDANVQAYGISPQALMAVLHPDPHVSGYAIFIAGDAAAETLVKGMPPGRAFVCTDTATLPTIFRRIFAHAVGNTPAFSKL